MIANHKIRLFSIGSWSIRGLHAQISCAHGADMEGELKFDWVKFQFRYHFQRSGERSLTRALTGVKILYSSHFMVFLGWSLRKAAFCKGWEKTWRIQYQFDPLPSSNPIFLSSLFPTSKRLTPPNSARPWFSSSCAFAFMISCPFCSKNTRDGDRHLFQRQPPASSGPPPPPTPVSPLTAVPPPQSRSRGRTR